MGFFEDLASEVRNLPTPALQEMLRSIRKNRRMGGGKKADTAKEAKKALKAQDDLKKTLSLLSPELRKQIEESMKGGE